MSSAIYLCDLYPQSDLRAMDTTLIGQFKRCQDTIETLRSQREMWEEAVDEGEEYWEEGEIDGELGRKGGRRRDG